MSFSDAYFTIGAPMDGAKMNGEGAAAAAAAAPSPLAAAAAAASSNLATVAEPAAEENPTTVPMKMEDKSPPPPSADPSLTAPPTAAAASSSAHTHPGGDDGDTAMKDADGTVAGEGAKPAATAAAAVATAKKKKGTATTVKAPKRAKGSTTTTKKAKSTKKKPEAAAGPGASGASGAPGAAPSSSSPAGSGGESDEEESDHGPYCVCRGPDDHRWMIQCDGCEDWFHGECVKITKEIGETLIQSYICPNCTDGKKYVTRYKKTCSLPGCLRPARVYNLKDPSIFCSQDHGGQWWEQLIARLPGDAARDNAYQLTQEEFMGLLASAARPDVTWKMGDTPFGVPPNFWETIEPSDILTEEETAIISTSAADRYRLAEEMVLCKKMLELLDLANERHRAAVAAAAMEKDACGYDGRLDSVGVQHQFAAFVASPSGAAILANSRLDAPDHPTTTTTTTTTTATTTTATTNGVGGGVGAGGGSGGGADPRVDGMCRKRKCKPHTGWFNLHSRHVRFQMKELAREAKQRLDTETRVRDAAARRYFRRRQESVSIRTFDGDGDAAMADES